MAPDDLGIDVLGLVRDWTPSDDHDRGEQEHVYLRDLREFLERRLNDGGRSPIGGLRAPVTHEIDVDPGSTLGDIVVDGVVGIELLTDVDGDQRAILEERLADPPRDYDLLVVCAVDVGDRDAWRALRRDRTGGNLDPDAPELAFVAKEPVQPGAGQEESAGGFLRDVLRR